MQFHLKFMNIDKCINIVVEFLYSFQQFSLQTVFLVLTLVLRHDFYHSVHSNLYAVGLAVLVVLNLVLRTLCPFLLFLNAYVHICYLLPCSTYTFVNSSQHLVFSQQVGDKLCPSNLTRLPRPDIPTFWNTFLGTSQLLIRIAFDTLYAYKRCEFALNFRKTLLRLLCFHPFTETFALYLLRSYFYLPAMISLFYLFTGTK